MPLKYQSEIDNLKVLSNCPEKVSPLNENLDAYRLSFSPITHQLNFLPNIVFDRLAKRPFNYDTASNDIKCLRCGASYYLSKDSLRKKWGTLSKKIQQNLGYTHIAQGTLTKEDGLMKEPEKSGHFTFYEFETTDLSLKFILFEPL